MSNPAPLCVDALASLANADTQRLAARLAQDVFTGIFRQAFSADQAQFGKAMGEVESRCFNWCLAGESEDGRALRLAMLISGLDQWGLAYSQAFGLTSIPALTALIGALRTRLDPRSEARFQWYFSQIGEIEADAIDFKIELRRSIHLALWHAMAACETTEEAAGILLPLGSLMLALTQQMPTLGWRLLADALANIQIGLLNDGLSDVARDGTQQLFESLRHALPGEQYRNIMAYSAQAVMGWQQARRARA